MANPAYDLENIDFSTCQSFSDLFDYLDVISKSPTTRLTDRSNDPISIKQVAASIYCYVRGSSDPKFNQKMLLNIWLHDLTRKYGPDDNNGLRGTVDRLTKNLTSLEGFPEELAHDLIGDTEFAEILHTYRWQEIYSDDYTGEFEAPLAARQLGDTTRPRAIFHRESR